MEGLIGMEKTVVGFLVTGQPVVGKLDILTNTIKDCVSFRLQQGPGGIGIEIMPVVNAYLILKKVQLENIPEIRKMVSVNIPVASCITVVDADEIMLGADLKQSYFEAMNHVVTAEERVAQAEEMRRAQAAQAGVPNNVFDFGKQKR